MFSDYFGLRDPVIHKTISHDKCDIYRSTRHSLYELQVIFPPKRLSSSKGVNNSILTFSGGNVVWPSLFGAYSRRWERNSLRITQRKESYHTVAAWSYSYCYAAHHTRRWLRTPKPIPGIKQGSSRFQTSARLEKK